MAVDFDDRSREIQDTAAVMLELADTDVTDDTAIGASRFRNPSQATVSPWGAVDIGCVFLFQD